MKNCKFFRKFPIVRRKKKTKKFFIFPKSMNTLKCGIFLVIFTIIHQLLVTYLLTQLPEFPDAVAPDGIPIFPYNISFGVSSAAYQIEENVPPSNWMLWEQTTDENGKPHCPSMPLKVKGIEHFSEDVQIVKDLGCDTYRLSFSWSRINPEQDQFNDTAIEMYRNMLLELHNLGIRPLVTLWHFEHPAWLEKLGGFKSELFVSSFEKFVEYVIPKISDLCDYYHTVNEPVGIVSASLIAGIHPPGKGTAKDIFNSLVNLMSAHAKAYHIIHKYNKNAKVSYAKNLTPIIPRHKWSLFESLLAYILNYYNSVSFDVFRTGTIRFLWMKTEIPDIKNALDYISLNHYYCLWITINPKEWGKLNGNLVPLFSYGDDRLITSDFGWGLKSSSLADSIRWVNKLWNPNNLSFLISEHGCADYKDNRRPWFLRESLVFLTKLRDEGISVESYIHWSLTDNYEWAEGSNMKFGLIEINFETYERKMKKSAELYKEIIKANHERSSN
ncbi:glycosyl hydrolase [Tritrichomonas foetus]|uniref:Glycosyl hydrolase n=1 Tax=Tritrichomonas foetus TaxID=1144522 RepID=A0A1J4JXT9_9EUKA|nr:glycosyl hydrolase [Tritrichomonas foetus]|eukprot:OHT03811.1 glycosyl hydrolase [Tritrichomonas foetus]